MKIAFLIAAHTDIIQLNRLINSLIQTGDIYIHLDKKSKFTFQLPNTSSIPNSHKIYFLQKRISVTWGGYSQIKGFKLLLEAALQNSQNYQRFVFLSGLDYPVYSHDEIITFFQSHIHTEFVCGFNISQCHIPKQLQKITLYHLFRDIPLNHNSFLRKAIIGGTKLILKSIGLRKQPYLIINGKKWNIFYGSQWISITKECGEYILKQLNTNKKLVRYFKTAYAPDELCIPTIVFNSPFSKNALRKETDNFKEITPLHYLNYTDHIWTYDENDFNNIILSHKMFVRKLISNKSEKLIELLEKRKNK